MTQAQRNVPLVIGLTKSQLETISLVSIREVPSTLAMERMY